MTVTMTSFLKAVDVRAVRIEAAERTTAAVLAEQQRQDAIAAAYAAGLDAGRAEALSRGADVGPRVAAALEDLARTGALQRTEVVDATSRAVIASAVDIAEWVLRHELSHDSRSILARLSDAAAALLPSTRTRAFLSVADEPTARPWCEQRDIEVVVDPQLAPGDARFDNGTGSVDVTVAAALRIAAEALGVDPARGVR